MTIFVKFWGTRGSIPTPGSSTRVFGGNTSCVEIRVDDTLFICDAGSGIRELGMDLMKRPDRPSEIHLLITHTHWDHIQGFPFFGPAYLPSMRIKVYETKANDDTRFRLLSGQMSSPYFPVSFGELGARIIPEDLSSGELEVNGVQLLFYPLNHPGGCVGYTLKKNGLKIVYATDNELELNPGDIFPDPDLKGALRQAPKELVEACRDADLLITDSQFTDEQYQAKKGWGHSACLSATDLAIQSNARQLALFHHDPANTNRDIERMTELCRERVERMESNLTVFAAREGIELKYESE